MPTLCAFNKVGNIWLMPNQLNWLRAKSDWSISPKSPFVGWVWRRLPQIFSDMDLWSVHFSVSGQSCWWCRSRRRQVPIATFLFLSLLFLPGVCVCVWAKRRLCSFLSWMAERQTPPPVSADGQRSGGSWLIECKVWNGLFFCYMSWLVSCCSDDGERHEVAYWEGSPHLGDDGCSPSDSSGALKQ